MGRLYALSFAACWLVWLVTTGTTLSASPPCDPTSSLGCLSGACDKGLGMWNRSTNDRDCSASLVLPPAIVLAVGARNAIDASFSIDLPYALKPASIPSSIVGTDKSGYQKTIDTMIVSFSNAADVPCVRVYGLGSQDSSTGRRT
eukprot:Opistho-2@47624